MGLLVDDVKIPTTNNPKLLVAKFDSLHSFTTRTTGMAAKVQRSNKVLKSLAASTRGIYIEILLAIYRAIDWPVVYYTTPCCRELAKTLFEKLH